jgi:putative ABC transport system ATP-binding protein
LAIETAIARLVAVDKSYREGERLHAVLHGADFTFRRGEITALVGKSGSGKSTVLNLLGGIDTPDRGRVEVDGVDLTALTEDERTLFRRRHIGFVFQFFNLIPTLKVLENVLLPLELQGRLTASHRRTALELLQRVGLAQRADSFPETLSGGEQQRVALARALAHDPPLLLADEPTGNLDEDNSRQVQALLQGLVQERKKTLILVTHSHRVRDWADRLLRIDGGRLVEGPQASP